MADIALAPAPVEAPSRRAVGVSAAFTVGAMVVVAAALVGLRPLADNSFFTHLATGRYILDHGIPTSDIYSFTVPGRDWVVQSWVPSVLYGLVDHHWGGHGLVLLQGGLAAAIGAIVWRLTRPGETLVSRLLAVLPVMAIGASWWASRPFMVGLVLFAVCVWLAEEDSFSPWWLVPIGWLWVNSHGSFPFGPAYLAVRVIGRVIDGSDRTRLVLMLKLSVLGVLAGGVLSPVGTKLLTFPLHVLGQRPVLKHVVEWRSPDFSQPGNLVFLVGVIGACVLVQRRRSWDDGLVALVFGIVGIMALRNTLVACIAITPVLARGIAGIGHVRGDARSFSAALTAGAVLFVSVVAVSGAVSRPAYALQRYPVAELEWMDRNGLLERRVAAPDYVGNLRTLREGAGGRVFVDDRYDMYPAGVAHDSFALNDGSARVRDVLRRHRIDVVLWHRDQPLATVVSVDPQWRVVHQTKKWVIAERV